LGVLHWSERPLGYCPHVTLPQENPLIWNLHYFFKLSLVFQYCLSVWHCK
jgi:hypothetical protein